MHILFIHQNIPEQFRHLIAHFGAISGIDAWALDESTRVRGIRSISMRGVHLCRYALNENVQDAVSRRLHSANVNVGRRLPVVKSSAILKTCGFNLDVVSEHPGCGERLCICETFFRSKIAHYYEFYSNSKKRDLGFAPKFSVRQALSYEVRAQNMTQSQSLLVGDRGMSLTNWQKGGCLTLLHLEIEVPFDGIDCRVLKPDGAMESSVEQGRPSFF